MWGKFGHVTPPPPNQPPGSQPPLNPQSLVTRWSLALIPDPCLSSSSSFISLDPRSLLFSRPPIRVDFLLPPFFSSHFSDPIFYEFRILSSRMPYDANACPSSTSCVHTPEPGRYQVQGHIARKKHLTPWDHHRSLGIGLL